jgi:predicted  nucleic acid-binding Zn-ribbon protein
MTMEFPFKKRGDKHLVKLNEQLDELHRDKTAAELTRQQDETRVNGGDRSNDAMNNFRNAVDRVRMLDDDISAKNAEIKSAQAKLTAEEDKYKAEVNAREIEAMAEPFVTAKATVKAARATMPGVSKAIERLPHSFDLHRSSGADFDAMLAGIEAQLDKGVAHVKQCAALARAGEAVSVNSVPEPVKVEPVYVGERKSVFLLGPSKWFEEGKIITHGRHRTVALPTAIADAALQFGHAVEPGSEAARAAMTLDCSGPDYAFQPENICVDLTKPRQEVRYIDEHRSVNLHSAADQYQHDERASGWVRDGRREKTGTATISSPGQRY